MRRVCAWCNRGMGEKEPVEDKDITHGMCLFCLLHFKRTVKKLEKERRGNEQNAQKHCLDIPVFGDHIICVLHAMDSLVTCD